jgi:hypothetical protein
MVLPKDPARTPTGSFPIGRRGPVFVMTPLFFGAHPDTRTIQSRPRPNASWAWLGLPVMLLFSGILAAPASAHHPMGLLKLSPSPLSGLLSGLAHPVLGPDHLLFLLALSLVGLRQRGSWMLLLLATSLGGSLVGLLLPGLPGAEGMVALTLVL